MKKIFRIFSVLVVLVAVMGLTSCLPGPETDQVVSIDSADSLATFLNSSASSGKLTDSFNTSSTALITAGKKKTLDLNGYTITRNSGDDAVLRVKAGGELTIKDSKDADEQGSLINEGTGDDCYTLIVEATGKLKITAGNYKAKRTAVCIAGTAEIVTTGEIWGDKDNNDNVKGDGIEIYSGGKITTLNCTVYGANSAVTNGGTIDNIAGGEYTADDNVDSSETQYCCVSTIYNSGTITLINGQVALTATNSGTGKAAGIYNYNGASCPTISAATKAMWTITAGTGGSYESATASSPTKAFYIYPVPNQQ